MDEKWLKYSIPVGDTIWDEHLQHRFWAHSVNIRGLFDTQFYPDHISYIFGEERGLPQLLVQDFRPLTMMAIYFDHLLAKMEMDQQYTGKHLLAWSKMIARNSNPDPDFLFTQKVIADSLQSSNQANLASYQDSPALIEIYKAEVYKGEFQDFKIIRLLQTPEILRNAPETVSFHLMESSELSRSEDLVHNPVWEFQAHNQHFPTKIQVAVTTNEYPWVSQIWSNSKNDPSSLDWSLLVMANERLYFDHTLWREHAQLLETLGVDLSVLD